MAAAILTLPTFLHHFNPITPLAPTNSNPRRSSSTFPVIFCRSESTTPATSSSPPPPLKKKKKRYRKLVPGEKEGITEEMRFVAMRLRNNNYKVISTGNESGREIGAPDDDNGENSGGETETETWQPSMQGFLKYLVDSKLVFSTIERIVDDSQDVSYAYFRNTGLERSESFTKDIEWFSQQDVLIPEPSNPGITYVKYLEELAATSPPLFLCHFYNIYFSHVAGGQVIAKQVSERLLEGRELEFYCWEGAAEERLKGMREKLNALGQHWSRDEKTRGLRETAKAFKYLGQIIRLIIL